MEDLKSGIEHIKQAKAHMLQATWIMSDCRLEELGDMEQGEWCLAEKEAELVEDAKKVLLEEMDDAIKRLKGKEAKEAAE